jgi:K+-sensing histidine kinase KdpD
MLVRRAKRMADFLHTDCFAVAVNKDADLRNLPPKEREAIERHLNFARNLHIETRLIEGSDPAEALIRFARLNGITHSSTSIAHTNAVDTVRPSGNLLKISFGLPTTYA